MRNSKDYHHTAKLEGDYMMIPMDTHHISSIRTFPALNMIVSNDCTDDHEPKMVLWH